MPTNINADNGVVSGIAGLKTSADNSGVLALQTNGTTAVTVDTSQKVGIGTATPVSALQVVNSYTNTSDGTIVASGNIPAINWRTASGGRFTIATGYSNNDVTSFLTGTGTSNPSTEIMVLDHSTFNVRFQGNIGIGATIPTTSGVGITFPATQSASSNANTLDDYEEGTWTPTVFGSTTSGTGTYSYQEGVYVKVGQMVTASAFISMSNNTGTGNIRFGGLPFTTVGTGTNRQAAAIGYLNNCSLTALNVPIMNAINNATSIVLYQIPTGGGAANEVPMDTSFDIIFTFTYRCNA